MNFKEALYESVRTRKERRQAIPVKKLADGTLKVALDKETPSLQVYFTPLTVQEMTKVKTLSQGDDTLFGMWLAIEKIEDEAGNKMFAAEDRPTIEQSDWDLFNEVNKRILNLMPAPEVKKTSEKTPSS